MKIKKRLTKKNNKKKIKRNRKTLRLRGGDPSYFFGIYKTHRLTFDELLEITLLKDPSKPTKKLAQSLLEECQKALTTSSLEESKILNFNIYRLESIIKIPIIYHYIYNQKNNFYQSIIDITEKLKTKDQKSFGLYILTQDQSNYYDHKPQQLTVADNLLKTLLIISIVLRLLCLLFGIDQEDVKGQERPIRIIINFFLKNGTIYIVEGNDSINNSRKKYDWLYSGIYARNVTPMFSGPKNLVKNPVSNNNNKRISEYLDYSKYRLSILHDIYNKNPGNADLIYKHLFELLLDYSFLRLCNVNERIPDITEDMRDNIFRPFITSRFKKRETPTPSSVPSLPPAPLPPSAQRPPAPLPPSAPRPPASLPPSISGVTLKHNGSMVPHRSSYGVIL